MLVVLVIPMRFLANTVDPTLGVLVLSALAMVDADEVLNLAAKCLNVKVVAIPVLIMIHWPYIPVAIAQNPQ